MRLGSLPRRRSRPALSESPRQGPDPPFSYNDLLPWHSHSLLDPLWSTEQTTIEYDGCEATRAEKSACISDHPVAIRRLRVCLARDTDYNCGCCEKCLRTIINLRVAGASGKCQTLPEELDLETVASMELGSENARAFALENMRALERLGNEPELVHALETALERNLEGEGARRQLAVVRAELAEIKRRLPRMAATHRRLRARSEELGMHNERLARDNAPEKPQFQPSLPGSGCPGQRRPQGAGNQAAAWKQKTTAVELYRPPLSWRVTNLFKPCSEARSRARRPSLASRT